MKGRQKGLCHVENYAISVWDIALHSAPVNNMMPVWDYHSVRMGSDFEQTY